MLIIHSFEVRRKETELASTLLTPSCLDIKISFLHQRAHGIVNIVKISLSFWKYLIITGR